MNNRALTIRLIKLLISGDIKSVCVLYCDCSASLWSVSPCCGALMSLNALLILCKLTFDPPALTPLTYPCFTPAHALVLCSTRLYLQVMIGQWTNTANTLCLPFKTTVLAPSADIMYDIVIYLILWFLETFDCFSVPLVLLCIWASLIIPVTIIISISIPVIWCVWSLK